MSRFKINYTTGCGQWEHQVIMDARAGVTGNQVAGTLVHKLLVQGVKAVITKIAKM